MKPFPWYRRWLDDVLSFWDKLFKLFASCEAARRPRSYQPQLEQLEFRQLMAALTGITEYAVLTSNSHPAQITAGPDGNTWFTEGSGNNIAKITPAGTITEYSVPTASGTVGANDPTDADYFPFGAAQVGAQSGNLQVTHPLDFRQSVDT